MGIRQQIEEVRERIERACARSGRRTGEIRLMGVSKFHGPEAVEEAVKAGLTLFGENRVQEAQGKFLPLREVYKNLELHMIGSLQRNKAKNALLVFDCIQSLDRDELITALGTLSAGRPKPLGVLLELHTGEESKSGYAGPEALLRAAELVLSFPGLRLSGLMTMAPYTQDRRLIRSSFRALAAARDLLQNRLPGTDLSCLSMGMSNDFEIAVEEGSTLLRIGTLLFGNRR
ncbi:MAG: YggS family pyridoxal phosphate-dependent enzyme [Spirochaetaceae bacterium]|jgi:pyridoxal phosphate enzyme (YggS family)|nr:YggS family pyridoxal phosphate-dependent enzyme [Spirochaetaceae bacterium]